MMSPGLASSSPWDWPVHFQSSKSYDGRDLAGADLQRQDAGDEGVDVVAWVEFHGPVGVFVLVGIAAGGDDVLGCALPAAAALVCGEAVEDGVVGGDLEVKVGGIDAQAGFVDWLARAFSKRARTFDEAGSDGRLGWACMGPSGELQAAPLGGCGY